MICLLCPVLSVIHGIYGKTIATSHKSRCTNWCKREQERGSAQPFKNQGIAICHQKHSETTPYTKARNAASHDMIHSVKFMRDRILSAMVSGMCLCVLISCLSILTNTTNTKHHINRISIYVGFCGHVTTRGVTTTSQPRPRGRATRPPEEVHLKHHWRFPKITTNHPSH